MHKITNKNYHESSTWERIHSLLPSGYIRKGSLQVFQKIRRSYPNDHILCIGYTRGDTQFAVTETFKTYEQQVDEVIDRCLLEELSMERVPDRSHLDCLSFTYHERFATIHCVPMRVSYDNIRPCTTPLSTDPIDLDANDDKTRKLVLLLHGPPDVVLTLFSRFRSVEKDISHLVSVPVQSVPHVFPKLFPVFFYPSTNIIPSKRLSFLAPSTLPMC